MLSNIRIVLVRTFHSGNIGSVARAMKTMGLTHLVLVNPNDFDAKQGKEDALKMARSADDVLQSVIQTENLYDAVKDCHVVIASTARERGYDLPYLNPEESALKLLDVASHSKVALVFGPERMGLSNDDLQHCHFRVTIPTHPDYSSLNIAAAVQTLSYEIYKQSLLLKTSKELNRANIRQSPDRATLEKLFIHMEDTLNNTGFIIKNHPGDLMKKLRQLYTRAELDESEVNILRGVLSSMDRHL